MNRNCLACLLSILLCLFCFSVYADTPKSGSGPVAAGGIEGKADKAAMIEAFKAQDWQKAIQIGEILTVSTKDDASIWSILGVSYFSLAQYEKALHAFEQEALQGKADKNNLRNIAYSSIRLNKRNGCDLGHQALEVFPEDGMLHNEMGKICLSQKQVERGLEHLQKAIELDKKNPIYVTDLTSYYFRKKDNANAEKWTAKAIANGLDMSTLYTNLVIACHRQGKYEDAVRWADEGYGKRRDPLLLYHKGSALVALGKMSEAEETLDQALKSGFGFVKFLLARVKMCLGCSVEAYATCATATPDPCCEKEKTALSYFADAESDQMENDTYDAFAAHYGMALILNGRFEQAEPLIRSVAKNEKNYNQALLSASLAVAAWNAEPRDDAMARRYYDEAMETYAGFKSPDTLSPEHTLAPRAIAILGAIADSQKVVVPEASKPQKAKGCGCDMRGQADPSLPGAMAILMIVGAALSLRRRKNSVNR